MPNTRTKTPPKGKRGDRWVPTALDASADPAGNRAERRRAKKLGIKPRGSEAQ
jgi:hypothetical protein